MTDYDAWADEYIQNAEESKKLMEEYKSKKKKLRGNIPLLNFYDAKIRSYEDMYYDCMIAANKLRIKAIRQRKRMGG